MVHAASVRIPVDDLYRADDEGRKNRAEDGAKKAKESNAKTSMVAAALVPIAHLMPHDPRGTAPCVTVHEDGATLVVKAAAGAPGTGWRATGRRERQTQTRWTYSRQKQKKKTRSASTEKVGRMTDAEALARFGTVGPGRNRGDRLSLSLPMDSLLGADANGGEASSEGAAADHRRRMIDGCGDPREYAFAADGPTRELTCAVRVATATDAEIHALAAEIREGHRVTSVTRRYEDGERRLGGGGVGESVRDACGGDSGRVARRPTPRTRPSCDADWRARMGVPRMGVPSRVPRMGVPRVRRGSQSPGRRGRLCGAGFGRNSWSSARSTRCGEPRRRGCGVRCRSSCGATLGIWRAATVRGARGWRCRRRRVSRSGRLTTNPTSSERYFEGGYFEALDHCMGENVAGLTSRVSNICTIGAILPMHSLHSAAPLAASPHPDVILEAGIPPQLEEHWFNLPTSLQAPSTPAHPAPLRPTSAYWATPSPSRR